MVGQVPNEYRIPSKALHGNFLEVGVDTNSVVSSYDSVESLAPCTAHLTRAKSFMGSEEVRDKSCQFRHEKSIISMDGNGREPS